MYVIRTSTWRERGAASEARNQVRGKKDSDLMIVVVTMIVLIKTSLSMPAMARISTALVLEEATQVSKNTAWSLALC